MKQSHTQVKDSLQYHPAGDPTAEALTAANTYTAKDENVQLAQKEKHTSEHKDREREIKEQSAEERVADNASEANPAAGDALAGSSNSEKARPNTDGDGTVDGFKSPRPVTDYLNDDEGLPGWAWTTMGVSVIGALDALDDNWSNEDDSTPQGNRPPSFARDTLDLGNIDEDTSITFSVDVADPDRDELSINPSTPANGTITEGENPNEYVYTPNENFNGEDQFIVVARDPSGSLDTLQVSVVVDSVEDIPEAEASQQVTTPTDQPVNIDIGAADGDGDELTYTLKQGGDAAQNGTVTQGTEVGTYIYAPNENFNGKDQFEVVISDGKNDITQVINVTVAPLLTLQVSGSAVEEGNAGTSSLVYTLSLAEAPSVDDVTFTVQRQGRSEAGEGIDYEAFPDTITIAAGETSADFVVNVLGDTVFEDDEQLILQFDNPLLEAAIEVTGVIINDDEESKVRIQGQDDSGVSSNDGVTNVSSPVVELNGQSGSDIEILLDGEVFGSAVEDPNSPGSYTFNFTDLDDGNYTIAARQAGSSELIGEQQTQIDTQAPELASVSVSARNDAVTFRFNEEVELIDMEAVVLRINGNETPATLSDQSNGNALTFQFDIDVVPEDVFSYALGDDTVIDIAGNALSPIES